jgi:microsomal epoxide hydrolase
MNTKKPFTIQVPEEVLTDLHERLSKVRWAEDFANPNWEYGTNGAYLILLCQS